MSHAIKPKEKKLFRENALRALETLDEEITIFTIITPSLWWWFIFITLCTTAFLVWAVCGKTYVTITGQGIIVNQDTHTLLITSPTSGIVRNLQVTKGQSIDKNQLLVVIDNPYLENNLIFTKNNLVQAKNNLQIAMQQYTRSLHTLIRQHYAQHKWLQRNLHAENENRLLLMSIYQKKFQLFKMQILTIIDIEKTQHEVKDVLTSIHNLHQAISNNQTDCHAAIKNLKEELEKTRNTFLQAKHDYDNAKINYMESTRITNRNLGYIQAVHTMVGQRVEKGQLLLTLMTTTKNQRLAAYVFVNQLQGELLAKGMQVKIMFSMGLTRNKYILGKITEIDELPANKETIVAYLGNRNLVDEFFAHGAPYLIKVKFNSADLKKIHQKESPFLRAGRKIKAEIITQEITPYQLLFT